MGLVSRLYPVNMIQTLKIFLLAFVCFVAAQDTCNNFVASNGCVYDLSSLTLPSGYTISDATLGNFTVNVCGAVNSTICGVDAGACQQQEASSFSCGKASSISFADYNGTVVNATTCPGVQITYVNGTSCAKSERTTVLNIGCDASQTGNLVSVTEDASCEYYFQMWASAACGVPPATSNSTTPMMNSTSPITSPVASPSMSASNVSSPTPPQSSSCTVNCTATNTTTVTPTNTTTVSPSCTVSNCTVTVTATATNTTTVSPSCTVSNCTVTAIATATNGTATATPSGSPDDSSDAWIWWTLGAVGVVILVLVIAGAGFFVYKKKRTTYDSLGDYDD